MTVRQLKALYPEGRLSYGNGEGYFATFITTQGPNFVIDMSGIPAQCFTTKRDCSRLFENKRAIELDVR